MIGGKEYFEDLSRIVESGLPDELFGDEGKEDVVGVVRRLADFYDPEKDTPEGRISRERFDFVHLRDAMFIHPDSAPVPAGQGMLWRCVVPRVHARQLP
jgi:hypothetical protein